MQFLGSEQSTVCAKQQAVVAVSFGSLQKVEQENKILGFSDQLVFAGRPVFQRIIGWVFSL